MNAETSEKLRAQIPAQLVKQLNGKDYISGQTAIDRLIQATGNDWSFRITNVVSNPGHVAMQGELTIDGSTRSAWGEAKSNNNPTEELFKNAETDCLKRCARHFGVALALYGDLVDEETGEVTHRGSSPRQNAPSAHGQPTQPRPASGSTISRAEATPRQIKYMHAMARELNLGPDTLEAMVQQEYGCTVSDLDRRGVSAMIEKLSARKAAQETPQATPAASNGNEQASIPIASSVSAGPITAAQKSVINSLLDPDSAGAAAQRMFGKPVHTLTTEEAQDLIDVERRAEAARS